jgi:hypothetical protein
MDEEDEEFVLAASVAALRSRRKLSQLLQELGERQMLPVWLVAELWTELYEGEDSGVTAAPRAAWLASRLKPKKRTPPSASRRYRPGLR